MLTDLNLLASPMVLKRGAEKLALDELRRELRQTDGPGWQWLNRKASRLSLKNAFEVTDGASALAVCESLARAQGGWAEPAAGAGRVPAVAMIAGAVGARGFDDCRIVSILCRAGTAGYLDDAALAHHLERHSRRILAAYAGWSQYLASVVVGKVAFQSQYADPSSPHVIDPGEFLEAVHLLALSGPLLIQSTSFWPPEDLGALARAVEGLIDPARARTHHEVVAAWLLAAAQGPAEATGRMVAGTRIDQGSFERAVALAREVFWKPVDAMGLAPVFDDLRRSRLPLWDLPARADGRPSSSFWNGVDQDREHYRGLPFLRSHDMGRLQAVWTEEGLVVVGGRPMRRAYTPVPWEHAALGSTVLPGQWAAFHLGGTPVGRLYPDWEAMGAQVDLLQGRLDAFLAGLGPRVRAFTRANPL